MPEDEKKQNNGEPQGPPYSWDGKPKCEMELVVPEETFALSY